MTRAGRRTRRLTTIGLAVLIGVAACGDGSDEGASATPDGADPDAAEPSSESADAAEAEAETPLEVEVVTETFVDTTRPTAAGTEVPAQDDRTLVTRIDHPTSGGPYPLLVMSHGLTGHPDEYVATTPIWAADGFVVATPKFPLTNREVAGARGNVGDVVNQPGDVSFVIDQVLAANDDPDSPLHGLVDPEAIGVVGHSLGGATTLAVAFDRATHDDRVDSATIFAGIPIPMPDGGLEPASGLPLLMLHGDADDVPLDPGKGVYEQAVSPKWFVTLLGATHVPAFTDAESPYDELVTRTVLDFWHGTLDGDADALARVTESATDPALSTVEHE